MKHFRTTAIIATSIVATLALASVTGFQLNEIIAEEIEKKGHPFAEDTSIIASFKFREGSELIPFEVFIQESGFDADEAVIFKLEKVVGYTPMLHKVADEAQKFSRGGVAHEWTNKFFGVDLLITNHEKVLRHFDYRNCRVTDYGVTTDFDKEEGWMGKGFAVKDVFEFTCDGYKPLSPTYDEMTNNIPKANTMSSMDLKEPTETWENNDKYKSKGFGQ